MFGKIILQSHKYREVFCRTQMRLSKSGNLRIITSLTLLALLIGVAFIGYLPQLGRFAAADSSMIQKNNNYTGCSTFSCSLDVSFPSNVTAGDVIVVLVLDLSGAVSSVQDSLGSTFTNQETYGGLSVFTATAGSSGSDSVTINDSSEFSIELFAEIFEISGVTTVLAQTAAGSGTCSSSPCDISTSSSVSFLPGAFLASYSEIDGTGTTTYTPAGGFSSVDTIANSNNQIPYATSGVTSPTDFPGVLTNLCCVGVPWSILGIVLEPVPTTTTVTVPTTTTQTTTSISTSTETTTATSTSTSTTTTTDTSLSTTTTTATSFSTSTTTSTSTIFVYPTTTHVSCTPDKAKVGQNVDCTAIVKDKTTPSGNVTFTYYEGTIGERIRATCSPVSQSSDSCSATIVFAFLFPGPVSVTAAYSGDVTHESSHGATLVHIVK
jgi:hypothetical protein